jgi:hypothetical protein
MINATGLQELAVGPMHSNSQAGQQLSLFGPAPAPASPSRPPASGKATATNVTCGRSGSSLSASAALQRSLENRLRVRLDTDGSMEYALTWKAKATPSGRRYCQLVASARPTSDNDYSGWPTPTAHDDNKSPEAHLAMKARMGRNTATSLQVVAKMSGWPTPREQDRKHGAATDWELSRRADMDLLHVAAARALTGWPSPAWHDGRRPAPDLHSTQGTNLSRDAVMWLTGWVSPSARDWKDTLGMATTGVNPDGSMRGRLDQLGRQVKLCGWATPHTPRPHDNDETAAAYYPARNQLNPLAQLLGRQVSLSTAGTGSGGAYRLNPAFSLWLMGFPVAAWESCAPPAMPSSRRSRRPSSAPASREQESSS